VTSSAELALDQSSDDRLMTAEREESKYLIDAGRLGGLLRVLRQELSPHRYTGQGANQLPDAHHYSTTIYFDTPSLALLRAAREQPEQNLKLRAREYYDLHSSLTELATDPEQIVRYQPWLWFELKRREQNRTFKHRLRLNKPDVPAFLRGDYAAPLPGSPERAEHDGILEFCASLGEPLGASLLVNYRRLALQDATGSLRVTLDVELSFYAPPADLWTRQRALVRGSFGAPRAVEHGCLLEVKRRATLPVWLERALEQAQAKPERFSKFLRAGQAVYGAP
jgi:hypothetical protein